MPANINTYIGRKPAWHALGTVTGHYTTWAEMLAHGGLDFEVFKSQLHDGLGNPVDAWGVFRPSTDGVGTFLGTVGADYTPIPHSTGFEMIDALMLTADGGHYETAGVLGKGEVVWGLADLGLAAAVGDDRQTGFLLFSTSHNGTASYSFRLCLTRVVCQNTLTIAINEKSKAHFRVKHTKNAMNRIQDAHTALEALQGDVQTMETKLNFLAKRKMTRESLSCIMERLFPKTQKAEGVESSSTRRENVLVDILQRYESNDDNAFPEQRGTAYNLLNAVTGYVDHARSSHGDMRAQSALFGSGDALKGKALSLILDEAKTLQAIEPSLVIDWADLGLSVPGIGR